jgi:hypothetical protein
LSHVSQAFPIYKRYSKTSLHMPLNVAMEHPSARVVEFDDECDKTLEATGFTTVACTADTGGYSDGVAPRQADSLANDRGVQKVAGLPYPKGVSMKVKDFFNFFF